MKKQIFKGLASLLLPMGAYAGISPAGSYQPHQRSYLRSGPSVGMTLDTARISINADNRSTLAGEHDELVLAQGQPARELMVVDAAVPDKHIFYREAKPGVDIVEINSSQPGLSQLVEVLGRYKNLSALHIVSHAEDGVLLLGNSRITAANIKHEIEAFAALNGALREGGDLLLYGCDLAKSEAGTELLDIVQRNTHLDLAASSNLTGSSIDDGDWSLEIQRGEIESGLPFSAKATADFSHILATTHTLESFGYKNGGYDANSGCTSDVDGFENFSYYALTKDSYIGCGFLGIDNGVGSGFGGTTADLRHYYGGSPGPAYLNNDKDGYAGTSLIEIRTTGTSFQLTGVELTEFPPNSAHNNGYAFSNVKIIGYPSDGGDPVETDPWPVGDDKATTTDFSFGSAELANLAGLNLTKFRVSFYNEAGSLASGMQFVSFTTAPPNTAPTLTTITPLTGATEDTPFTISYADLAAAATDEADADGDTLSFRVEAVSTGTLTKNSAAVTLGATLLSTGEELEWTPAADANGTLNAFTVRAWDGTTTSSSDVQVQVDVTAVEDDPEVSGLPTDVVVLEDTPSNFDLSAATFTDGDGDSLTVTLTAGAGSFAAGSGGSIIITGSGTDTLTLTDTPANINTFLDTTSNIQYTGAADASGNDATTVTVNATDGNTNPLLGTINVDITGVNDPPEATNLTQTISYTEDQGGSVALGNIVVSDVDAGDTITATLTLSDTAAGVLTTGTFGSATSTFTAGVWTVTGSVADTNAALAAVAFTPSPNWDQDATITMRIRDAADTGLDGTITLDVTPVNDAPTDIALSSASINQSTTGAGAVVGSLSSTDVDTSDIHTYTLVANGASDSGSCGATGGDGNASFQIDNDDLETSGSVSAGTHNVCIETNDGTVTFQQAFTITVTDDVAPAVSSVDVPDDDTYGAGQELEFTVNTNEDVTVSGTPQIALTVGSTSRQADYVSGSGSSALLFRYTVQVGDNDSDGITVESLSDNGGSLRDGAGNDLDVALNSVGATTAVLVDTAAPTGHSVSFDDSDISSSEATSISFTFAGAEVGADYSYTISSSGGGTPVTDTGAIASATDQISGIDVTGLENGTLTLSVTVTDAAGNGAAAVTATTTLLINRIPTLTATAGNPTFTENDTQPAILFSDTAIDTLDSGQVITGLTLTVDGLGNGPDEQLLVDGGNIALTDGANGTTIDNSLIYSVSVSGTTAALTLSGGTLPVADAQTLVDGLAYSNSSTAPTNDDRVVTLTGLNDSGADNNSATLTVISTVTVAIINDAPIIGALTDLTVTEGDPATLLFPSVNLSDTEGNFDGGTLTLSGLLAEDTISLQNAGSGAGQIAFDGTSVSYQGTTIGTAAGGDGNTFSVTLNASATVDAVNALIEHLTYANDSDTPTASRILTLGLTDAEGAELLGPMLFTEVTTPDNPFDGVALGNYSHPSLGDLDGDGDLDAFIGQEIGGLVNYFENTGSDSAPVFEQRFGADNPLDAAVATSGRAKPTLVDSDNDGDLDVILGNADGALQLFENTGTANAPVYTEVIGSGATLTLAGGGTPSDSDSNGSNDLYTETLGDLTMTASMDGNGSWTSANVGTYGGLSGNAFYFNGGSVSTVSTVSVGFSRAVNLTSFVYAEADGDNVGTQTGSYTFTPVGTGSAFTLSAADFEYSPTGGSTGYLVGMTVEPADWTNVTGFTISFSPTGGGYFSPAMDSFTIADGEGNPFNGIDVGVDSSPAMADIDDDGDMDILVGNFDGDLRYFENTGDASSPSFTERTGGDNPFDTLSADNSANPAFLDVDRDGDLDLFLGGNLGQVQFFRNTGTAAAPAFTEVTGEDNPFDTVDFSNNSAPAFADIDNDGSTDALVGEWNGSLHFFAGSPDTSAAVSVNAVNDAPIISGTPATSVNETQAYSFTPTASDPDADPLTFSIANAPAWASFDTTTGALTGTPDYDASGSYSNIVISASDGTATTDLAAFTIDVNNVNRSPLISGAPATALNEAQAYSFVPTASDPDANTLVFSIANAPAWASFNTATGALTGTPDYDAAGTYGNIIISVGDGEASVNLPAFTIEVANVNRAPAISGAPATVVNEAQAYSFVPSASDPDADTLTFSIANAPVWASFNTATGALNGTPDHTATGTYGNIVISASDGTATTSLPPFTINVVDVNRPPVIGGTPAGTVNEGQIYSFIPTASDPDADPLTFSIANVPTWASFNTATGALGGSPSAADTGTYSGIVISVSDGTATAELSPFAIEVITDTDTDTDTDGDGVSDHQEEIDGTDPNDPSDYLDLTPPDLIAPADITLDAIALYTPVSLQQLLGLADNASETEIQAALDELATDNIDGDVCCNPTVEDLLENLLLLAPGANEVTWLAEDRMGNMAEVTQRVNLRPLVSLNKDQTTVEGNNVTISVILNGESPSYPFTVPFIIDDAGTTTIGDHDLVDGNVIFTEGQTVATITVNIIEDGLSDDDETLIVRLDDHTTNAEDLAEGYDFVNPDIYDINSGSKTHHIIRIVEDNLPPDANLQLQQEGVNTSLVTPDRGLVTATVSIFDANPGDTYELSWSASDNTLADTDGDTADETLIFDPSGLSPGRYKAQVAVTDSAGATTTVRLFFQVVASLPALSAEDDTDGDGIDDSTEGTGDFDGDGIPDYLDDISASNVLPQQAAQSRSYVIECEPGVRCGLGQFSLLGELGGAQLEEGLNTLEGLIPDPDYTPVGGIFDFAINLPEPGQIASIVIPQPVPVPEDAVYRKFRDGAWHTFATDDNNGLYSTAGRPGYCPPPNNEAWQSGLTPGHLCVQLVIEDGGPNDADGMVNGTVEDPGAVSIPNNVVVYVDSNSGGGAFDKWLLALFGSLWLFGGLAAKRGRRLGKALNHHGSKAASIAALLFCASMIFTATPTQAQTWFDDKVSLELGVYNTESAKSSGAFISDMAAEGVTVDLRRYETNRNAWQIALGYEINDWATVQVGYLNLGDVRVGFYADAGDYAAIEQALEKHYPFNADGFTLAYRYSHAWRDHFEFTVDAGLFSWDQDIDVRFASLNPNGDSGTDPLLGLGVGYQVNPQATVGLRYQRLMLDPGDMDLWGGTINWRF